MREPTRIEVRTGVAYDVLIGRDLLQNLPRLLPGGVRRVAVVHPSRLHRLAGSVHAGLTAEGFETHRLEVPDSEAAKTTDVAASCWAALGRWGFTRSDAVVGLGGGATTDLAGFVASTWLRGVPVVHAPTTLLGMVDAAVGGKTAVNTAAGKNLVGTFHEPTAVLCDLDLLRSLARAELVSGLAEVVKCGFVADPAILELVESEPGAAVDPAGELLAELIERAVRVKAAVVSSDLRETATGDARMGRQVLNYGHTLGHAIERVEGYRYRHGEAVAVGMVYAAELARLAGRLDEPTTKRHRRLLASLGLPTAYPGERWPALHEAMRIDKKARGDRLRFVVLDGLAQPGILDSPDPDLLRAAYEQLVRQDP